MTDDLETLFPEREIVLGGETVKVKPFTFGQLPKAIKLLRPVTDAVGAAGIAGFDGTTFKLASDWALRLPQLMDEGGEALLEFVAFSVGKPRAWLDTLAADDGIMLTKTVFETNSDFFARRIMPKLGMVVPANPQGGPQSSPGSSEPVIDGPTSSATH